MQCQAQRQSEKEEAMFGEHLDYATIASNNTFGRMTAINRYDACLTL